MQLIKNLSPKQRIVFFILSALALISISLFIATYINRLGKVQVTVQYAPYSATVTLNNTQVKNPSKIWIEPGSYKVIVKNDHFENIERDINISQTYTYIIGNLSPIDSEGEEYINNHKHEFTEVEGLMGKALNEEGLALKKQYPILKYLPINNRLYSISYSYNNDNQPIINIKTTPEYLDVTTKKLKSLKDVDLTIYQINYSLSNPFEKFTETPKSSPKDTIESSFKLSNYKISAGQNIANDYYAATIYKYDYDRDLVYYHYRVLLKKEENKWHIVSTPQPLLTKNNTPNISTDILNSVNSLEP